jgi:integrase
VYEIQAPKTEESWRTIPLPPTLVAALKRHRGAQAERRLQPLMFGSDQGTPLNPRNLSQRYLRPIIKEAKLPTGVTLYTFRHTCATLALAAGLTANVVAERLGHASTQMVLDTYGHVLAGMQEEATAKLGALLFGDS